MKDELDTDDPARSSEPPATHSPSTEYTLSDRALADKARTRYKTTWDVAHLDKALLLYQRAIDHAPEPNAYLLGQLGHCLNIRYRNQGKLDDLERGIAAEHDALHLTSDEHPDKALRLHNLSHSLRLRYERLGEISDLKNAMTMQLSSVELTPADHPSLSAYLDNLGELYRLRYERFGELDDLERSIANRQRAVDLAPDDHPFKPTGLNNLGVSLRRRFERLSEPGDLEHAITAQRRAVELTPDGHPDLPARVANLGSLQWLRYERFGDLEDLESAIAGQRRDVELTPDGHPFKPTGLNNLGMSLRARFERLGEPDDLERAITAQRCAVELVPEGYSDLPTVLANLGYLQLLCYRRFGGFEDLQHAIKVQQRAVGLTPNGHSIKSALLHNLALSLAAYFRRETTRASFDAVFSCYMEATSESLRSPIERLKTAQYAIDLLNENDEFSSAEARVLAHSRILDILPEIVWFGHNLTRRLEESKHLGKLVNTAVCVALDAGALAKAVEWLDAGRGLIWTQMLSFHNPVDELELVHPDLAGSLKHMHARLHTSGHISSQSSTLSIVKSQATLPSHSPSEADRHRALAIEYGKLLEDIRGRSGFEDFMRPKKFSSLLESTTLSGAVVFINVDKAHCDAVILGPDGKITSLTLLELTLDKAEKLRFQWQSYLLLRNVRQRSTMTHSSPRRRTIRTSAVRYLSLVWRRIRTRSMAIQHRHGSGADARALSILHCLWKWVVLPVLEALGLLDDKGTCDPLPHVTWCPTGPLTQLPLHAAGVYGRQSGPRVYDYVVSTYTPSLSALTRSIECLSKRQADPSLLVVTQSDTPGMASLPGATLEGKRLQEVLSESPVKLSRLNGKHASTETVRSVLDDHSWLHLACHGSQNAENPLQSAFALHDGPLSLADLMATTAENAELAFLSACQTAVGDEKIPEESMHLAAGMLAVGYKGVIATMWSIRDDDAPLVVEAYYKKLLELRASGKLGKGETGAAYALHEAAERLREHVGVENVVRWAPFVHFGI